MQPTLLMAEDDIALSRMYERAFIAQGITPTLVDDGEKAIQTLKSMMPKPAVVILDVLMPKKSGFDVVREMKEDSELKDIPVVFLSNLDGQKNSEKGVELGAILYLVKSQYSPKEIVEKIKKIAEDYLASKNN